MNIPYTNASFFRFEKSACHLLEWRCHQKETLKGCWFEWKGSKFLCTIYGCFLKWWYPPQNTLKWSFLEEKPMVVGYHYFRRPPYPSMEDSPLTVYICLAFHLDLFEPSDRLTLGILHLRVRFSSYVVIWTTVLFRNVWPNKNNQMPQVHHQWWLVCLVIFFQTSLCVISTWEWWFHLT